MLKLGDSAIRRFKLCVRKNLKLVGAAKLLIQ